MKIGLIEGGFPLENNYIIKIRLKFKHPLSSQPDFYIIIKGTLVYRQQLSTSL